jgi:hypothetical protein
MARGKNYVNNNRGVYLQAGPRGKTNMKLCEYGLGCTRADCVYRHEEGGMHNGGRPEVCIPFLAGKCSFEAKGCRKVHPAKDEVARLLAKYKRTRCRFGDDCYTDSCLYLHPRDSRKEDEPAFVEPHHFPPLNGGSSTLDGSSKTALPAAPKPIPNSAWNAAPVGPPKKLVSATTVSAEAQRQGPEAQEQHSRDPNVPMQGPPHPQRQGYGIPPPPPGDHPPNLHEETPPQPGWGYSDQLHHEAPPPQYQPHHYPDMMMPPPPAYYGGPPAMSDGGHFPMVDPNTGYPIDPAYYEPNLYHQHQELQHQDYHPHMAMAVGMPYHPPPYMVQTPYGIPFNAEAKEFVPGNSTLY